MKEKEISMDIWECALGFMNSQALLTAESFGFFNVLAKGPRTSREIASETGVPHDSTERLLGMLAALEIVRKLPDGTFINSTEATEMLVRGEPGYAGSIFNHLREDLYLAWYHCKDALLEGKPQWQKISNGDIPHNEKMFSDSESLRAFLSGMHAITYDAAVEFSLRAPEMKGVKTIVDLGGASGAFLIGLAKTFPHLHGTLFDLPQVQPIAEDFIHAHKMSNRIRFHSGDFWKDAIPQGADAYSLGFILHDWDTDSGSFILDKIAKAIRPGGLLIIGEYLLNAERTGPVHVTRMDLNMLVAAHGRERTAEEYREWIGGFGFELIKMYPTSKGKHFLLGRQSQI
jgi:predicted O-methyltransferase YrrM